MRISHDEKFDDSEVFVQDPESSLTVEVDEDLYLHVVPQPKKIIGFTIHRFRAKNSQLDKALVTA